MPTPALPRHLRPMKAVSGELPPDDAGWAVEIKWDGMRALAFADHGELTLMSGNQLDATASFPEIAGLARQLGDHGAVLDGELVATDASGRPSFGELQKRMHVRSVAEAAARSASTPVTFVAFDLLWLDGLDATGLAYVDRRRLLAELVQPAERWQISASHEGDAVSWLHAVKERGMEGLVLKRLDSRYEPGRRSPHWRKVKIRREQEFVVGGWVAGERGLADSVGGLIIGYYDGDRLVYAGRVGSGLKEADRRRLGARFAETAIDHDPFTPPPAVQRDKRPHFVRPDLVVQVAFGEWTSEGIIRHPSYVGERPDKDPRSVVREP
jgi:bifunctional non-homologous end joining protein LigD